ncbi:hypothetical protein [Candidatus Nitrosotenuis cloacae]|uniref:hypothetical protein n=1 Tax=Candidatus Nitrosotenuis cloacae TaxID=1603555 RepID=UPI002281D81B|nr:hypothetical protein [Candidatus Nitrosotenuis cloacae]
MSTFDDFYKSLLDLVDLYAKKGVLLKTDANTQSSIIRIFGENLSSLARARTGLEDVSELAYTTAEHHPYWNLLYHACQISHLALEKWDDTLTKENLDEIAWSIDELKNTCENLKAHPHSDHSH